jgi:hypothetical protein
VTKKRPAAKAKAPAAHRDITALHRYFLWADRMREDALELIRRYPSRDEAAEVLFGRPYFVYWYAGAFVLLDGWRRLGLRDAEIDGLLTSENVKFLEQHRQAAYNFQPRYFDDQLINFVVRSDAEQWINRLHEAFGRWFSTYVQSHTEQP